MPAWAPIPERPRAAPVGQARAAFACWRGQHRRHHDNRVSRTAPCSRISHGLCRCCPGCRRRSSRGWWRGEQRQRPGPHDRERELGSWWLGSWWIEWFGRHEQRNAHRQQARRSDDREHRLQGRSRRQSARVGFKLRPLSETRPLPAAGAVSCLSGYQIRRPSRRARSLSQHRWHLCCSTSRTGSSPTSPPCPWNRSCRPS